MGEVFRLCCLLRWQGFPVPTLPTSIRGCQREKVKEDFCQNIKNPEYLGRRRRCDCNPSVPQHAGRGVLHREAAIIDAIGCANLTNLKGGDYYGRTAGWSQEKKLRLGTFLLFKAFKIFLQEGERQIRPVDLRPS